MTRRTELLGPERGRFRASLGVLWLFSGTLALMLLPLVIVRIVQQGPMSWGGVAAAFASLLLVPLLSFGFAAPFFWIYRIRVHELGLHGYDAYGRFFSVRWTSMTRARRVQLLTLEYLRVETSEAGIELVIPLFLTERAAFERLVAALAGASNPIARHFEASDAKSRGGPPERRPS